jgi:hypothetical protein
MQVHYMQYHNLYSLFPRLEDFPVETAFHIIPVYTLVPVYSFEGIDTSPSAEWL